MNQLKVKALIISLIMTFACYQVDAQKLAHINKSEIMQSLPEVKEARDNLKQYSKEMQSQVKNLMKEYRTKLKDFQDKKGSMSATIRSDKQRELKNLEQRIQKFRKQAQKKVTEKEKALLEPIVKRMNNAIEKVAKQKGYTYVFDKSQGGVLYAKETKDITSLVKKRLK